MKSNLSLRCIDINSPYCPCLLADTNHCVFCSHLKGEPVCDCNWAGICILYEKRWQAKNNWRNDESPIRMELETPFIVKEQLNDDTYLLEFEVMPELAHELKKTGSFVFLRKPQDAHFFHFPVGVMKVVDNKIQVVVEAVGPKSARILDGKGQMLHVRGPYYNGIFGQPWIDVISGGTIVVVAGGMGLPPALPIIHKLTANKNNVIALLAPGRIGKVFIEQEVKELGVNVYTVLSMRQQGMKALREWFGDTTKCIDLVVSAGPDEQHYGVISAMQQAGVNIPMAATNNATMCCGEGICGSCEKETKDKQMIRTCKVQADFTQFVHD